MFTRNLGWSYAHYPLTGLASELLVSRTVKRVEPVALIDLFLKVRALHPSTRQQFIQLCARTYFVGDVCTNSGMGTHLRADIVAQTSPFQLS